MEYKGVWILAEQFKGRVQRISHELLTRGLDLAAKRGVALTAVIFGHEIDDGDLSELIDRGADAVIATEAPELAMAPKSTSALQSALKQAGKVLHWGSVQSTSPSPLSSMPLLQISVPG